MIENNLDKLIEQGERVREEKKWDEALVIFDRAIIQAANQKMPDKIINVLGHKLIVYKHLFYETENILFLELFKGEVLNGLNIANEQNINDQPRALMLLRLGDYFLLKKNYKQSVVHFKESLDYLDQKQPGLYGEYLGHFGFGQFLSGDETGFETLDKAYTMVEQSQDLRPFHKLIILCGINLRSAQAWAHTGNLEKANQVLVKAENQAQEINDKYHLPLRLEEVLRLKNKLNG